MRIGGLQKNSFIDYPGHIAAVVFTQGCNLRCPYCHNPELVLPSHFKQPIPEDQVLSFLAERRGKLDGVVVSGGEPTIHADLPEFLSKVKALGYPVKLDTNGTNPGMLRELFLCGLLDYVAMDVKAPAQNYAAVAGKGVDFEIIKASIRSIRYSGIPHEFRTTVVPGLHTVRELKAIAELVHGADKFVVQDFVSDRPLRADLTGRPAFANKPLRDIRAFVERRVKAYEIRTADGVETMPDTARDLPESLKEATYLSAHC